MHRETARRLIQFEPRPFALEGNQRRLVGFGAKANCQQLLEINGPLKEKSGDRHVAYPQAGAAIADRELFELRRRARWPQMHPLTVDAQLHAIQIYSNSVL
jgi:hypothetical protein